eukprot:scaffold146_cov265-Pinguiococcus_pyrenoidosus.AAC.12
MLLLPWISSDSSPSKACSAVSKRLSRSLFELVFILVAVSKAPELLRRLAAQFAINTCRETSKTALTTTARLGSSASASGDSHTDSRAANITAPAFVRFLRASVTSLTSLCLSRGTPARSTRLLSRNPRLIAAAHAPAAAPGRPWNPSIASTQRLAISSSAGAALCAATHAAGSLARASATPFGTVSSPFRCPASGSTSVPPLPLSAGAAGPSAWFLGFVGGAPAPWSTPRPCRGWRDPASRDGLSHDCSDSLPSGSRDTAVSSPCSARAARGAPQRPSPRPRQTAPDDLAPFPHRPRASPSALLHPEIPTRDSATR